METAGAPTTELWPSSSTPSSLNSRRKPSSFRLRCSSLNSLRLRRVFDLFDKNGDGLITADEISQALLLLGLDSSDPSESSALESIVNSFIQAQNHGLTFDDFAALHKSLDDVFFLFDATADDCGPKQVQDEEELEGGNSWPLRRRQRNNNIHNNITEDEEEDVDEDNERLAQEESDLSEAFKVFDEDGDGFISARELQIVLVKLGLPEAEEMDRVERMISSVDRNNDGLVDFFEFKEMMRDVIVRSR